MSNPQPNLNKRLGLTIKWLCKPHPPHHTNSMSVISQVLLTQFWWNFKYRFLGTSRTYSNCHGYICPGNICPHNICPYQEYQYKFWYRKFYWNHKQYNIVVTSGIGWIKHISVFVWILRQISILLCASLQGISVLYQYWLGYYKMILSYEQWYRSSV